MLLIANVADLSAPLHQSDKGTERRKFVTFLKRICWTAIGAKAWGNMKPIVTADLWIGQIVRIVSFRA
jgi:hypothetical protein